MSTGAARGGAARCPASFAPAPLKLNAILEFEPNG